MDTPERKLARLMDSLRFYKSLAVAFSGGADSAFLLKCALDALGGNVLAVTVRSELIPEREIGEAAAVAGRLGARHAVLKLRALSFPGVAENNENRCYLCKRVMFSHILETAREFGAEKVAEGSNVDDLGDYRPGMTAVRELGVWSPLLDAGLGKAEIRSLSKSMGLETWDKPACACLASRIPFGQRITLEKLGAVEKAERFLAELGFRQARVRHHGTVARVELEKTDMPEVFRRDLAEAIDAELRKLGFSYVALDLGGYRTGSLVPPERLREIRADEGRNKPG